MVFCDREYLLRSLQMHYETKKKKDTHTILSTFKHNAHYAYVYFFDVI